MISSSYFQSTPNNNQPSNILSSTPSIEVNTTKTLAPVSTRISASPPPQEDILTLTIPMKGTGSDSLGITVKGKRAGDSNKDDGIYVKSVLKGGAASKVCTFEHLYLQGRIKT